jgi:hypothetical protein
MRTPAWYLLLWAALVASLVASLLGFSARSQLGERSPRRAIIIGFLLGIFVWGPIYGIAFELFGTANAPGGALLGALHGAAYAVVGLIRARRTERARSPAFASIHGRRIITRVVYGAVLGFLYVVPSP